MARKNGYRPGSQVQSGGWCLRPGCESRRKIGQLMCLPHWRDVPRSLKDALKAAAADGTGTAAYRDCVAAIADYARQRELEQQGAAR